MDEGRADADRLADRLAGRSFDRVETSPVGRAQETAARIAAPHQLPVQTVDALDEIDFGDWTGRRFDELSADPAWHEWNRVRAEGASPGGETMRGVQARILDHIERVARSGAIGSVAMVTHGDVIRAAVAGVLGLSLDHIHRYAVDPASVTHIRHDGSPVLITLNEVTA